MFCFECENISPNFQLLHWVLAIVSFNSYSRCLKYKKAALCTVGRINFKTQLHCCKGTAGTNPENPTVHRKLFTRKIQILQKKLFHSKLVHLSKLLMRFGNGLFSLIRFRRKCSALSPLFRSFFFSSTLKPSKTLICYDKILQLSFVHACNDVNEVRFFGKPFISLYTFADTMGVCSQTSPTWLGQRFSMYPSSAKAMKVFYRVDGRRKVGERTVGERYVTFVDCLKSFFSISRESCLNANELVRN